MGIQSTSVAQDQVPPATGPQHSLWADSHGMVLLAVSAAVLYLPLTGIPRFADDYLFYFNDPRSALFHYFVTPHSMGGEFRPLQMAYCAINQLAFGDDTHVLQAVQVGIHTLLAMTVLSFLHRAGVGRVPSFLAALWLVTSPAAVSAILGNDTFSQVAGTLGCFVSFVLAWRFVCGSDRRPGGEPPARCPGLATAVLSVLAFALALLCKETSLAYAVILPGVLAIAWWRCRALGTASQMSTTAPTTNRGRVLGLLLAGYVAVVCLYFVWRGHLAPTHLSFGGTGSYDMRIGINVPVNQAMLYLGTLLPVSTADLIVARHEHATVLLAGAAVLTTAWLGLLALGLIHARVWTAVLGLLVAASCAVGPVTLMNHVSELYTHNMAPFVAILIGLSLAGLLERYRTRFARGVVVCLLTVVLVSNVVAVVRKAGQMRSNGDAAAAMLPQVADLARTLPPQGRILLVERHRADMPLYSVFLTSEFHGLNGAEERIRFLAGHPDIVIQIVGENELEPADLILMRENARGHLVVRPP